jgi:hypothetical protein
VLKDNTKSLTRKVNEKLPDGNVSEELISKWLRDVFSDPAVSPRIVPEDASSLLHPPAQQTATTQHGATQLGSPAETLEAANRRIGLQDLLASGLLIQQDQLLVEGIEGRRQTATLTTDGKINVAGQVFDSVSPAALRALELAGKALKAVNGWATFRVMRAGNYIGTLLQIRGQYEDREHELSAAGQHQNEKSKLRGKFVGDDEEANAIKKPLQEAVAGSSGTPGPDPAVLVAVDQMKPLLALLSELTVNTSKSAVSLYAAKLVVAYAYPRKKGLPKLRVYVGETCPEWVTPDPTYSSWCYIDDWSTNLERVVALCKDATHRRADDMAAGLDAYRRRTQPPDSSVPTSVE